MKIYTSYFYHIRHLAKNMIPISTACWDPKYFHDFTGDYSYVFKDKRGIYNGIRGEMLHFPYDRECGCGPQCVDRHPEQCDFLREYKEYLYTLNFQEVYSELDRIAHKVQEIEGFEEEPIIVLLVYEVPTNPCSERKALQEWFADNGVIVEEMRFTK